MERERFRPDVLRQYEGEGIVVHWEPNLCIHVANCIRSLPDVFDPSARPWVRVDAASADGIAGAIRTCPSGALRYERTDRTAEEAPDVPTTIQPQRNGPLYVRGDIEVIDRERNITRKATRMTLCRCGQSDNKPFCDLSHRAAGFLAE